MLALRIRIDSSSYQAREGPFKQCRAKPDQARGLKKAARYWATLKREGGRRQHTMARRIGTVAFAVLALSVSVVASRRAILSEAGGAQVLLLSLAWSKTCQLPPENMGILPRVVIAVCISAHLQRHVKALEILCVLATGSWRAGKGMSPKKYSEL